MQKNMKPDGPNELHSFKIYVIWFLAKNETWPAEKLAGKSNSIGMLWSYRKYVFNFCGKFWFVVFQGLVEGKKMFISFQLMFSPLFPKFWLFLIINFIVKTSDHPPSLHLFPLKPSSINGRLILLLPKYYKDANINYYCCHN